ncbi:MAG TPA: alpha,alpha-trehalose-phosphate synthase [Erwinia persicina]|uniref:Trehalose-6-phosphate synthase n=1 Tax=Erwinia persicina TaxID=55211 RepID=A0A3S7S2B8_9GAMM|nr:alpha,alpha-trehalose-phosphate synthase [Erwinia persicina]AXU94881.1 alpha,alpha-trehalose-phosphate synthase [Erwinia persicina]MBC3943717.1 alpha,alpha-trehalose-phosphate synthase [Erwinia persicina]MBD8107930.1 alpha,alpha-trehalose-phosphate synthase [Erwinia persicina]MBD8167058.1 alpha,alpha-trehalose-phosphate synthase [Erwinia persicina]MBD8211010.1 alpha,alpha-trehalose-phosphate synthase [Erwinia persicina]
MSRLVVVSNRIAIPDGSKASAGGLTVGIVDALKTTGGVWYGWNGDITEIGEDEEELSMLEQDGITYASFGLNQNDYDLYYLQFSNAVLWPAFHYRLDLVNFQREAWDGYQRVNTQLAQRLVPLLQEDDVLWIHDYHLLPFAAELRKLGVNNRIGFFLHIPFPTPEIFNALPPHADLLQMMCDYDLLGFQTESDRIAFLECVALQTTLNSDGKQHRAFGNRFTTEVYPIGIEPDSIKEMAEGPLPPKMVAMKKDLGDAKNIIACERLDYSKGLPERFLAYEALLENYPEHRGKIRYSQIAPTSRGDVQAYQDIRHQLETEAGRINGKYGTLGWTPLYYLNQHFDRRLLMKIFRLTDIGLVTPLRDGMNLVAKEYVAAQDPDDPGVLVLSRFAGAANELTSALIVNPYDRDEVAAALNQALTMSRTERISRYNDMMNVLRQNDIAHWRESYLQDLQALPIQGRAIEKENNVAAFPKLA